MVLTDALVEPAMRGFEEVFREHSELVFGTACSITRRGEDAEDVVQTVFMRLLRRGMPPEFRSNPKAYLYRAAINQSLNIIRTESTKAPIEVLVIDHVEKPTEN